METRKIIDNLLSPYIKTKDIIKFNLYPTSNENCFKCEVFFSYKKLTGWTSELEVSFFVNNSTEPCDLSIIKNTENVFNILPGHNFDFFLKQKIKNRIKGADKESRAFKIAKEMSEVSSDLRISKVLEGSDFADNSLKVDLWFTLIYNYKGNFDKLDGSYTMMIGVQIKGSHKYQNIHKQKNPYTPSIVIKDSMYDEDIKEVFKSLLFNASRFKLRQLYVNFSEKMDTRNIGITDSVKKNIKLSIESLHL
jgi:hypothetical protein